MKTRSTRGLRRLLFKIRFLCDYAEQIGQLEKALARKPEKLQLDIIESGELPPDTTLLMRSVLVSRSSNAHRSPMRDRAFNAAFQSHIKVMKSKLRSCRGRLLRPSGSTRSRFGMPYRGVMPFKDWASPVDKVSGLERGDPCGNLRSFSADRGPVVGRQNKNRKLPSNHLLLVFEVLIG
jgi:hypothetical protein